MQDPVMTSIPMAQKIVQLNHPMCFCGKVAVPVFPTSTSTEPYSTTTTSNNNNHHHHNNNNNNTSNTGSTPHPTSYSHHRSQPLSSQPPSRPKNTQGYGSGNNSQSTSLTNNKQQRKFGPPQTPKYGNTRSCNNWVYECHFTPIQPINHLPSDNNIRLIEDQIEEWDKKNIDFETLKIAQMKIWEEVRASRIRAFPIQDFSTAPTGTIANYFDPHNTDNIIDVSNRGFNQEPVSPIESSASSTSASSSTTSSSSSSVSLSHIKGGDQEYRDEHDNKHEHARVCQDENNRDKRDHDTQSGPKLMDHNSRFKSPRQSSPSVDQTIPKAPDQFFSLDSSFFATAAPITSTTPQQKGEPPTTIMTATTYNNNQQHPGTFIDIVKTETRLVSESKTALGSVSSTPMVRELDFVSTTAATLDSAPPRLPAAVSKPPAQSPWNPDIKVCGFHMHALEWHKMQKLKMRDQITLTERARCPIFNLSVTRWLRNGANHLQKEPFNTVECLCGDPMVVALELSPEDQGSYDLVCPKMLPNFNDLSDTNEYSSNPQMKSSGQQEFRNTENYEGPKSRIDQNKSHDRFLPCPKVIKMSEVMYSPRMERVHSSIPNDEWLDRCYWPRPTRRSYYASPRKLPGNITSIISHHMNYYPVDYSKFRGSKATQDMAKASVRVRVKEKPDRILPKQTSPSSKNTNGGDDTDEWLRDWFKQSIVMSDAILNGGSEGYFDLWSPDKVHDLDKWNVHEVPKELIDFSVKEALKDAKKYADRYERKVVGRLEAQKAREGEIEGELMRAWNQRAEWAKEINMMDKNMGEMTHKCRICYERVLTHAVLPCYHLVMCGSCASMVNECIVCRVKKTGLQRIYWG